MARIDETEIKDFDTEADAFDWLEDQVNDPYTDNFRFAFKDNEAQMEIYAHRQRTGCCGSADVEITIGGKPAIIGCNYGH